jgi:hypothetical protein
MWSPFGQDPQDLRRHGIRYSITVRQTNSIRAAIAAILEHRWVDIADPPGGAALVAEAPYRATVPSGGGLQVDGDVVGVEVAAGRSAGARNIDVHVQRRTGCDRRVGDGDELP